jgi:hypothetical protein
MTLPAIVNHRIVAGICVVYQRPMPASSQHKAATFTAIIPKKISNLGANTALRTDQMCVRTLGRVIQNIRPAVTHSPIASSRLLNVVVNHVGNCSMWSSSAQTKRQHRNYQSRHNSHLASTHWHLGHRQASTSLPPSRTSFGHIMACGHLRYPLPYHPILVRTIFSAQFARLLGLPNDSLPSS